MVQVQPGVVHEAMIERDRALRGSTCSACVTRAARVVGAGAAPFSGLTLGTANRPRFPSASASQVLTLRFLLLRCRPRQPGQGLGGPLGAASSMSGFHSQAESPRSIMTR
jgi:hypothetical protein